MNDFPFDTSAYSPITGSYTVGDKADIGDLYKVSVNSFSVAKQPGLELPDYMNGSGEAKDYSNVELTKVQVTIKNTSDAAIPSDYDGVYFGYFSCEDANGISWDPIYDPISNFEGPSIPVIEPGKSKEYTLYFGCTKPKKVVYDATDDMEETSYLFEWSAPQNYPRFK